MLSRRLCSTIATVVPLFAAQAALGVIFYSTGDPTFNSTAPTGSLLNSGWQYQGIWSGFLGTPVGPNHFLTAAHIGGGTGSPFVYNGVAYTTVAYPDAASYKNFGDLRLYKVDKTFTSYAPLYDASADGMETTKSVTVFGRGRQRGAEISVGGVQKGWNWGAWDGVERWGQNKVSALEDYAVGGDQKLLKFAFDSSGTGSSGINEATLAEGDSGGAVFINVYGQWKLAGINYAVSGPYSYGPSDTTFLAALYDIGGLYDRSGTAIQIADTTADKPSSWYASRISPSAVSIKSYLNLPPTWKLNGSGVWGTAANWANATAVPNAVDAIVDFRTAISAARIVTLDAPRTVGTLNFDSSQQYTLIGSPLLTFDVSIGSATVNVASGNHTISVPVALNDATVLNVIPSTSTLTISGPLTATGKTITKQGAGIAELSGIHAASLVINQGNVKILPSGGTTSANRVSSLTVSPGTKLDLADNHLVVDYTGATVLGTWTGTAYAGLQGLIASGLGDGSGNGNGITSSIAADTNGVMGLGIAEASDVLGIAGLETALWNGQMVDASSVLIRYTHLGDANLDGLIDGTDYFFIDFYGTIPGSNGFSNGDFNYDGVIDGTDYFYIDSDIVLQNNAFLSGDFLAGVSTVPEPAMTCLFAMAGGLLLCRVRRV